ncbi:Cys-tRNA(Pro) deacylase [Alistipes sp. OttesenSCG-928-B03]|nr:Cys-tRNA(Pro) deacylase [Alistipes sp. OttesenSCG-928-B03]
MKKEAKTNAARLLDKAGVAYRLNAYEVDEDDLSAVHVARQLGVDAGLLFKTLVVRGDRNGIFVCVIAGDAELDLKKAAKASGNKNADLVAMKELLPLTGYIRGGCSPVGMKKRYPTFVDVRAGDYPEIYISAGVRGLQIVLAPADLIAFADAQVTKLTL